MRGATDHGFTVTGLDGNEVQVTTSSSTTVIAPVRASLSELEEGSFTAAVGSLGADGSLEATTIQQDALANGDTFVLPDLPGLPDDLPAGPVDLSDDLFSGLGCDPDAIATTALAAGR